MGLLPRPLPATHPHPWSCQVSKTLNERISRFAQVVLESCAYAGTGNVLKVRALACGALAAARLDERA